MRDTCPFLALVEWDSGTWTEEAGRHTPGWLIPGGTLVTVLERRGADDASWAHARVLTPRGVVWTYTWTLKRLSEET